MAKVLFVDDEPDMELLAKQKFRKQIESGAFELLFAPNGQKALEVIEKDPSIAVVVSDVYMPEMDGLTLLDKLKETSPETKTIVVSAYGDTKTLRSAMNKGAYDFVTKPVDFKELEETILRTLKLYKLPSSPLYTYQKYLAKDFPNQITLSDSHNQTRVLWDAFDSQSETLFLLGVSILPSNVPMEIGIGIVHSLLKTRLQENKDLSIGSFEKEVSNKHKELIPKVIIGHYHSASNVFSYKTSPDYKVSLLGAEGKTKLIKEETALLSLGDIITLEHLPSLSHLSLACLK